jgi:hypothetical protein
MPLKWFICPDQQKITVADCLKEGGCRMGDRCATRSYLQLAAKERPTRWRCAECKLDYFKDPDLNRSGKGLLCPTCGKEMQMVFSTTGLIRGTLESFLMLTMDYAISPDSRAYMVLGTSGHKILEGAEDECSLLEQKFDSADSQETGISDVIESENGKTILTDFKTSGSYKVAKALGFKVVERPSGEFYKSGKRKGEEKMNKELVRDDQYIDRKSWEIQLNKYRIEAEKAGLEINGKKIGRVDELRIQCIVRDGGTYIARSRGVFRNIYYFKIGFIPDEEILAYYDKKRSALLKAIRQGCWNEICDKEENWDGIKCSRYCNVAEYCPFGKYLKEEKIKEDEMIKGLSEVRRLPRLGKIRLGVKVANKNGNGDHPTEVDYFVFDPQTPSPEENERMKAKFVELYGDKPKQINIMFPVPDPNVFFAQDYKRYGSSTSLQCKGDGETATCAAPEFATGLKVIGKTDMGNPKVECKGRECPYYKENKCSEVGVLQFLLPELPGMGVWQISTGSYHSIVNVNSCIDYIRQVCGRVHMIPLKLERKPQETAFEGKKREHYILQINTAFGLTDLQRFANVDPSKVMLGLPEPEIDKEDILFGENRRIEALPAPTETTATVVATVGPVAPALTKEQPIGGPLGQLAEILRPCEAEANEYLASIGWVAKDGTWHMLTDDKVMSILNKQDSFKAAVSKYIDSKNAGA